MRIKFNEYLVVFLLMFISFQSCQDEEIAVDNPDEQEVLSGDSELANLISAMSANNGSYDDFLDGADCFSIELPITVIIDNTTIVVENEDDIEDLEDIFDDYEEDDDFFDFVFPITIIFSDYTQVVIQNEDQLEGFIEDCGDDDDDDDDNDDFEDDEIIECVDFVYPITFSIFNIDFLIAETVTVENDEDLYDFIEDLEDDENAIIAGINYPISLIYVNGETVEVNSNEELEDAFEVAEELCEEDDDDDDDDDEDCDIDAEELEEELQECISEVKILDADYEEIGELTAEFNEETVFVNGIPAVTDEGDWSVVETDDEDLQLIIEGLQTHTALNGIWEFVSCEDDYLWFTDGNNFIKLQCQDDDDDDDDYDCDLSAEEISNELIACDFHEIDMENHNEEEVNQFYVNFNDGNEIAVTGDITITEVGTWSVVEIEEDIKLMIDGLQSFAQLNGTWTLVECDDELKFANNDYSIYLECEEEDDDEDYFECFEDAEELEACDEADGVVDGFATFDLNLIFEDCATDEVEYSFYLTLQDAEAEVAPLPSPFTNTSNPQVIYSRVALAGNPSVYEIFEHELVVEQCDEAGCSEVDIDNILHECAWTIDSYNGSDNLDDFYMLFQNGQDLLIEGQGLNIDANWSTSEIADGVVITFSSVSGPNIQAINGDWLVVECDEEELYLQALNSNDTLILERDCD
ncbi:MAG: hypothetical protein HRU50_00690 [Winogradskyella sp.]|uniref:hypothetical protein n=1 Tax=Winogradskyella sp. TaxID=1883156 RepID=UPI0025D7A0B3|nr:hypothetical protein [Winogradskyella sp.]NRB58439.1 hypothetical protein [Winogradskyella sp.]